MLAIAISPGNDAANSSCTGFMDQTSSALGHFYGDGYEAVVLKLAGKSLLEDENDFFAGINVEFEQKPFSIL